MRLRASHMGLDTSDLSLEAFDPGQKLLDRHRIQILLGELHQRVAGLARKQFVEVHVRTV